MGQLYERAARRILGKTVTELLRESARSDMLLWLLIFLALGVALGKGFRGAELVRILMALVIGIAIGHVFW